MSSPTTAQAAAPSSSGAGAPATNPGKVALFLVGAAFAATPWCEPWMALALGIVLALLGLTAFDAQAKKLSRLLIQICIVMLGLRLDLPTLRHAAVSGLVFAAATIVSTMALGLLVGKLLKTGRETTLLVSSGTAVCGGSAIAAVGGAIGAAATNMAVATGAVFVLNAIALYVFPPLGHWLGLSDAQFGTWAGVAIHDMSSVMNAAKVYHHGDGPAGVALDTANVVKLSRVIWIAPIALFAGWLVRRAERNAGVHRVYNWGQILPVFIVFFLIASAVRTFVPVVGEYSEQIKLAAGSGFQLALFLIGAGLSKKALKSVGWRAMVLAITLWVFISVTSLIVVRATVH